MLASSLTCFPRPSLHRRGRALMILLPRWLRRGVRPRFFFSFFILFVVLIIFVCVLTKVACRCSVFQRCCKCRQIEEEAEVLCRTVLHAEDYV